MEKNKSKLIIASLFFAVFYFFVHPAIAIEVGGIQFENNAFPDTILSTTYAGGFVNATTLDEALLGPNLSTYIDYDMPPPGQDPSTYIRDLSQYVQLGFTDNDVYNADGNDLVFFQAGSANAIYVCLDTTYEENVSIILPTSYIGYYGGVGMNAGYLDLTTLGVPAGEKITSITVSSWRTPSDGNGYGVPEIVAVGALHSTPASNRAPNVEAGSDLFVSFPEDSAELSATVSDDGLPDDTVTVLWQQVDGPSSAVIVDCCG